MSVRKETEDLVKTLKKSSVYRKNEHRYFVIDMKDSLWMWGHYGDTIHVPEKKKKRSVKK